MCWLSIEDIHKIREENYNKTKTMTDEQLIKYTQEKAKIITSRLKNINRIKQ